MGNIVVMGGALFIFCGACVSFGGEERQVFLVPLGPVYFPEFRLMEIVLTAVY